jgi:hypothetical protein
MSKMKDYIRLSDSVTGKNVALVREILRGNTSLDMTCDDGELFILSIRKDNVEVTKLLLEYYKNHQLSQFSVGSSEYNILQFHFNDAIRTATEGRTLSSEMKALLSPYIDFEGNECDDDSGDDEADDHNDSSNIVADQRQLFADGSSYISSDNSDNHSVGSNVHTQGALTQLQIVDASATDNSHPAAHLADAASQHCSILGQVMPEHVVVV